MTMMMVMKLLFCDKQKQFHHHQHCEHQRSWTFLDQQLEGDDGDDELMTLRAAEQEQDLPQQGEQLQQQLGTQTRTAVAETC